MSPDSHGEPKSTLPFIHSFGVSHNGPHTCPGIRCNDKQKKTWFSPWRACGLNHYTNKWASLTRTNAAETQDVGLGEHVIGFWPIFRVRTLGKVSPGSTVVRSWKSWIPAATEVPTSGLLSIEETVWNAFSLWTPDFSPLPSFPSPSHRNTREVITSSFPSRVPLLVFWQHCTKI